MTRRWIATTTRALPALVVVCGCLGAVAYAASGPASRGGAAGAAGRHQIRAKGPRPGSVRPPRPLIVKHPRSVATAATANFAFKSAVASARFQCRLDGGAWKGCKTPLLLSGLALGNHVFLVRAVLRRAHGPAARFAWALVEPKPFSIEPQLSNFGSLYPGAAPSALPVIVRNPNPIAIFVTSLRVVATADAPGCAAAANLVLTPSSVSTAAPLSLPAGGSASLPTPAATAPAIGLRNLPVNQDACQGASFPLAFSGQAHG